MMQNGAPNSHFTTHRPVAVLMVFLSAVVFGFFSLKRLPVTLMLTTAAPCCATMAAKSGSVWVAVADNATGVGADAAGRACAVENV